MLQDAAAIRLSGVAVRFGTYTAVRDVDIAVRAGEFVGRDPVTSRILNYEGHEGTQRKKLRDNRDFRGYSFLEAPADTPVEADLLYSYERLCFLSNSLGEKS